MAETDRMFWWDYLIEDIRTVGFVGILYDMFDIDSDKNARFIQGYKEGLEYGWKNFPGTPQEQLKELIEGLSEHIPRHNPSRTRAMCTIRGFKKAYKERFGVSELDWEIPRHRSGKVFREIAKLR